MPGLSNTGVMTQWIDDATVIVGKISPVTGKLNKVEMKITKEQFRNWWENGELIQNAMPNLSTDEREFLISGCFNNEEFEIFCGIR